MKKSNNFWKLGWRNIFRNKRRTFLTSLVIGTSLGSIIIQNSMMEGTIKNIFQRATSSLASQAQIHGEKFLPNFDMDYPINNKKEVLSILEKDESIKNFSKRAISFKQNEPFL